MIVGLGNPGEKYAFTRHNVGFRAIEVLKKQLGFVKEKEEHKGIVCKGEAFGKKIMLVRPLTYMNNSGECISELLNYYKIPVQNLIVIFDDVDIPEGSVRVRIKGGAGTHNGMRSIVEILKSEDFPRVRIGTANMLMQYMDLADFVLSTFDKTGGETVGDAIERAAAAAAKIVESGCDSAMRIYNKAEK